MFSEKVPLKARIAFESSGLACVVSRPLARIGYEDVTAAHPKEIAYIVKPKKKNDKAESLKLAKLHLVGVIPESHLLEEDGRIMRDLPIHRVKLEKSIASIKNSIIGYLKRESLFDSLPKNNDNFSEKRRKAMKEIRFGNQKDLVFSAMSDRLAFFEKQIIPLAREIKKTAKNSDGTKILMQIPGIDYCLASLLSSYIGDIRRFESGDKLASFFGIIPTTGDSPTIRRRGHMPTGCTGCKMGPIHCSGYHHPEKQAHKGILGFCQEQEGIGKVRTCIDNAKADKDDIHNAYREEGMEI